MSTNFTAPKFCWCDDGHVKMSPPAIKCKDPEGFAIAVAEAKLLSNQQTLSLRSTPCDLSVSLPIRLEGPVLPEEVPSSGNGTKVES
jgi:hypothetical protein